MIERMTDEELGKYLGIDDLPADKQAAFIRALPPARRALFDRMATLEHEVRLWQDGLGPKPTGVIICEEHRHGQANSRKAKRPPRQRLR